MSYTIFCTAFENFQDANYEAIHENSTSGSVPILNTDIEVLFYAYIFYICLCLFFSSQGQRTVYRLTIVKEWNSEEIESYAKLVDLGKPDLIEIKVNLFKYGFFLKRLISYSKA